MATLSKIKQSKVAINTTLSTKKSESIRENLTVYDEKLKEVNIEDLKKSNFTYGGAFPFLTNAISQLCTLNPQFPNGDYVIREQNNLQATHFSAVLKWKTLVELATGDDILSRELFRHEVMKVFKTPPEVYVNLNNGYGALTHPFIIRSIVYEDLSEMSKKDADTCSRLGITKQISYVDIEFLKPMFNACLEKRNHKGFIYLDPAFYAKEIRTIREIQTRPELTKTFQKFYNPKTGEYIIKTSQTYYKYILYFLTHVSDNPNTDYTTINAIDMLRHVDPKQLQRQNGKDYIKNKYDTKLFIDKAGTLYNTMAKLGYCENTFGVIKYCTYDNTDDYRIYYQRERPRTSIESYTSNFIESEVVHNEPIVIDYRIEEERNSKNNSTTTNKDFIAIQNGI